MKAQNESKKSNEVLLREVEALRLENQRLQAELSGKTDDFNKVEILNTTQSLISLKDPDGKKNRLLHAYGGPNCRVVVPERFWVHWFEQQIFAIINHEIRVEKYVVPEGKEIPKEWKNLAFTPDEIKKFLKKKPDDFKKLADQIEEPDVLIRWFNVVDGIHETSKTKNDETSDYPSLLTHANYLSARITKKKRELYEVQDSGEMTVDIYSRSIPANKLKKDVKSGQFRVFKR
jgi:hypothetical protein